MTTELKKAIEVLKMNRPLIGRIGDGVMEAIDTVVEHCEQKTYTAEDMNDFAEWTAFMQWIYDPTDNGWFQKHSSETKITAQLREIWEQSRKEEQK